MLHTQLHRASFVMRPSPYRKSSTPTPSWGSPLPPLPSQTRTSLVLKVFQAAAHPLNVICYSDLLLTTSHTLCRSSLLLPLSPCWRSLHHIPQCVLLLTTSRSLCRSFLLLPLSPCWRSTPASSLGALQPWPPTPVPTLPFKLSRLLLSPSMHVAADKLSYILQVIFAVAPQPLLEEFYSSFLSGDLAALASHPSANFALQAFQAAT